MQFLIIKKFFAALILLLFCIGLVTLKKFIISLHKNAKNSKYFCISRWKYVDSESNPADKESRGTTLANSQL